VPETLNVKKRGKAKDKVLGALKKSYMDVLPINPKKPQDLKSQMDFVPGMF
jgi:hypothetical protein